MGVRYRRLEEECVVLRNTESLFALLFEVGAGLQKPSLGEFVCCVVLFLSAVVASRVAPTPPEESRGVRLADEAMAAMASLLFICSSVMTTTTLVGDNDSRSGDDSSRGVGFVIAVAMGKIKARKDQE